ncbi:MAG: ATP-dependent helicase, partial [Phycisphaerae bacterium]
YILIDEYQDTNHAQYVLAHALGMGKRNVAVVGDPDQSIYAWRGADIQNILDFEKDYADATVVRLEQNYRSTKVILQVADALIANNSQRKDKRLWTENDDGQKPEVILAQDEHDEAKQVTQRLKDANEAGVPWSDMAVFYRMNSLSRVMEDALRHANVPYQIARGVEFYNRKEIKDVLAYLKYVANPADEVALTRIINTPTRGIGNQTVNQLTAFGVARGLKLHEALDHAGECEGLSSRAVNAVRNFATLVRRWRELTAAPANAGNGEIFEEKAGTVQRVMEAVVREAGFEQDLRKKGDKEQAELNNVYELISSAAEYDRQNPEGTLIDYLGEVSLVADADHMKGNGGAVTLMTLHAAKGLEFPVVAIIGLEEGILPHGRARGSLSELEEERRLCFVGITRAQQRLILGKANIRTVRGIRERTITSPFLNELPAELLDVTDRTGVPDPADRHDPYGRAFDTARAGLATPFRKGDAVRHPKFGTGTVFDVAGMGTNTRVVVDFQSAGRKTLILEYARLEPA